MTPLPALENQMLDSRHKPWLEHITMPSTSDGLLRGRYDATFNDPIGIINLGSINALAKTSSTLKAWAELVN